MIVVSDIFISVKYVVSLPVKSSLTVSPTVAQLISDLLDLIFTFEIVGTVLS